MRLSNKSTFSLVCFIFLLAFIAMPVWSHPIVTDDTTDPVTYDSTHVEDHAAHPILEKIELMNGAADGYVGNGESFTIRITFSSDGAAPTNFALTNIGVPSGWLVADLNGTGLVYTARVTTQLTGEVTTGGVIRIPAAALTVMVADAEATDGMREADIYDPDPVTSGSPTAEEMMRRPAIILDATAPTFPALDAEGAPEIKGTRSLDDLSEDQWSGPFTLEFTITGATGATPDASLDLSTIRFEAEPDVFSFDEDNISSLGGDRFAVTVTPKAKTTVGDETEKTAVTITISVDDKAGNTGMTTATANLAPRKGASAVVDATFSSAAPASGNVMRGDTITVTFNKDPGPVTADVGAVTGTGATRTITIPATQAAGAVTITLTWGSSSHTLNYTVVVPTDAPLTDLTVPAESYVIIHRGSVMGLPSSVTSAMQVTWTGMPNLEDLFFRGGTLALTITKAADDVLFDHDGDGADLTTGLKADGTAGTKPQQYGTRNLIITEVMAALNTAMPGTDGYTAHQWIEIYNPLKVAVSGAQLAAKSGRPALTNTSTEVLLDRLSNVTGAGWGFSGLGQNGFDDGQPTTASTPFVSFYRNKRDGGGENKGHWTTSTDTYLANHKGTPGAKERSAVGTIGATSFNVGAIVFNEIGNRSNSNKDYEWIELRNKSGGNVNVKNWQISIVTGVGSDNAFYTFPNTDRVINAGDILLLVRTDPTGDDSHPLVGGWDVTKGGNDQAEGHRVRDKTHDYLVANFAGDGLPDDGKFVLILRNHNNKRGTPEHLIDIAGYDDDLTVSSDTDGFTNLWPLKGGVRNAQLGNNKLEVDQVHRRQKDNIWGTSSTNYGRNGGNHHDDTAWRNVGWQSGIGYKRNVAENNAHGGTPGYPNNAQKNEGGDAVNQIIISEIMYNNDDGLPQWIELQNMSNSVGVNLNNWKLFIVNHSNNADGSKFEAAPLEYNISLNGYEISPNQTILIVSDGTRRNTTNLPNSRILNRNLARDKVMLNPYGFYLTLKAKTHKAANEHQLADTVGNLSAPESDRRGNLQPFNDIAWELPSGLTDDGTRTSISRRISDKITASKITDLTGTKEWHWLVSADDPRLNRIKGLTYYGHVDDEGSPGHKRGGALPVSLSHFRPALENGEVVIRWTTESELDNAGFNILRSDTRNGEFKQVNAEMIQGNGTTGERSTYKWVDASAKPGVVYYYQIEDVSFAGERETLQTTKLKGYISAVGKATTTWGDIKEVQ